MRLTPSPPPPPPYAPQPAANETVPIQRPRVPAPPVVARPYTPVTPMRLHAADRALIQENHALLDTLRRRDEDSFAMCAGATCWSAIFTAAICWFCPPCHH